MPNAHILMPTLGPVIWLTHNGSPERDNVGLTSETLSCDRMAYRYRVTDQDGICVPWSDVRDRVNPQVLFDLEAYADPSSWWLSSTPIGAVLA